MYFLFSYYGYGDLSLSLLLGQGVKKCVNEAGIGFMMSPIYHPAMKIVSPVRKKLKVKTIFNILGPMLNPARVPFAVIGVNKEDLVGSFMPFLSYPHSPDFYFYFFLFAAYIAPLRVHSDLLSGYVSS